MKVVSSSPSMTAPASVTVRHGLARPCRVWLPATTHLLPTRSRLQRGRLPCNAPSSQGGWRAHVHARLQPSSALREGAAGEKQQPHLAQDAVTEVLYLALAALATCPAASAAETVSYNPAGGEDALKTLAGIGYIILVIFYFFRLFRKRAKAATSQPLASTLSKDTDDEDSDDEEEVQQPKPDVKATPLNCFIGAAQAGVICFLLYQLTQVVDSYFLAKPLPDQYTARNIAVLVQTVVRGLAYLITFIFGANALGLTGLMIQLILFPNSLDESSTGPRKPAVEKLPDVSVTDDIFAIRRAFKEAERQGQRSAAESSSERD